MDAKLVKQLEQEQAQVSKAIAHVQSLPADTQDDLDQLQEIAREALARKKERDETRKYLKAPALEAQRRVDAVLMPLVKGYDQIARAANGRLAEAEKRLEAEREKALAEIAESGGHAGETTILTTRAPQVAWTPGSGRDVAYFEVTDLDKIPREFMIPDMSKLNARARAGVETPGGKIVKRKSGT